MYGVSIMNGNLGDAVARLPISIYNLSIRVAAR
jgi:hypothetical protein